MSIVKKLGGFLKKALPIGLGAAGAYFGVPAIGGLFSGKQSPSYGPDFGASTESGTNASAAGGGFGNLFASAAPFVDGALGFLGAERQNAANARQAQQQMEFQAQQNATSWQRGTADMKAAGLNPMLAYSQGGAASGAGAQAEMHNSLGEGANSAVSAAQTVQQLNLMQQQILQSAAQTKNIEAQTRNTDAMTAEQLGAQRELWKAQGEAARGAAGLSKEQAASEAPRRDLMRSQGALADAGVFESKAHTANYVAQTAQIKLATKLAAAQFADLVREQISNARYARYRADIEESRVPKEKAIGDTWNLFPGLGGLLDLTTSAVNTAKSGAKVVTPFLNGFSILGNAFGR